MTNVTAVHCAASRGHVDCLDAMLQQDGVDVDASDKNGCAAVSYAASYGHTGAIWRLRQSRADFDHRDNHGRSSALYYYCCCCYCYYAAFNAPCVDHMDDESQA